MKTDNAKERLRKWGGDINELTKEVIGAAYEVSNTLGVGFLEKVYERPW